MTSKLNTMNISYERATNTHINHRRDFLRLNVFRTYTRTQLQWFVLFPLRFSPLRMIARYAMIK